MGAGIAEVCARAHVDVLVWESTRELAAWASGIGPVGDRATYFNFLASHDGIGMRPAHGLLSAAQQAALVDRVLACGGRASRWTTTCSWR